MLGLIFYFSGKKILSLQRINNNSEKKLSEEIHLLEDEKCRFEQTLDMINIGIWEIDGNNNVLKVSQRLRRICHLSPVGDFSLKDLYKNVHADDLDNIKKSVELSVSTCKKVVVDYRYWINGNLHYMTSNISPRLNNEGKWLGYFGTVQDITDTVNPKNVTDQLYKNLKQIADNSPNVVYILDENQEVVFSNKTFDNYCKNGATGLTLSGETYKEHTNIFLADAEAIHELEEGESTKSDCRLQNIHDGRIHWFSIIKKCFKEKEGKKYLLCFCSDITDRYQMEVSLKAANEMVERSLKVKDQFISNMSHEIRTPLNAVIGFTDLISNTSLTHEQTEYIEIVKNASQTLLALINNILDLSKIESGNLALEFSPIDVKQIVKDISRIFEPKAKAKNVQISTHLSANIPAKVLGDQLRLSQIVFNLLGNAMKFTDKGSIDINCDVVKGPDKHNAYLSFSVSDTGIGIPNLKQHDIFERFTQANIETQRLYGGSGLGLSIVKSIIDMYGGTLTMESKEGVGTSFRFILPFKKYAETKETPEVNLSDSNSGLTENENTSVRILLAEDNLVNAMLAKEVLRKRGFEVYHVTNGELAVEAVQQQNFDLIIMDIQMPVMNGITATENIRKLSGNVSEIPIIAMTAHSLHGEMQNCYNAGMNVYVSKPFKPDDLYAAIMECVSIREKNKLILI